jgi:molybdopterin converting factor small subunit
MRITVRTFAHLRERFGAGEMQIELAEGACVRDAWQALAGEAALPGHVLAAVNFDYAGADQPLSDADEVAFLPPVTGG